MELTGIFKEKKFETYKKKDDTEGEKAYLVITYQSGQYEQDACFMVWNDNVKNILRNIEGNVEVTVSFDPKSRQWKDRWFTDNVAWSLKYDAAPKQAPAMTSGISEESPILSQSDDSTSDLPF